MPQGTPHSRPYSMWRATAARALPIGDPLAAAQQISRAGTLKSRSQVLKLGREERQLGSFRVGLQDLQFRQPGVELGWHIRYRRRRNECVAKLLPAAQQRGRR